MKKLYSFLKSRCKNVLIILAGVSIIISVTLLGLYVYVIISHWNAHNYEWTILSENIYKQLSHNIGDFLWGTIGIVLTFTATIFLFVTFREQREQLRITKEQSDKARFETTYFNILGMLKQVQDTVNANVASRTADSQKNLIEFYKLFKQQYDDAPKSDADLVAFHNSLSPLAANTVQIEQLQGLIASFYEKFIEETNCNIGYFYRYIFNAMKFVIEDQYNKEDIQNRDHYLNLLQAQLSNEELCFIFYNAISKYGKNKEGRYEFKEMLDKTHFLENIDCTFMLDRKHYILYPHTIFKFLSRDEISHVLRNL